LDAASKLNPGRLAKQFGRGVRVLSREEPTQYDIEALDANIRRVGLVINVRWALVAVLALFSLAAGAIYATAVPGFDFAETMMVPALALLFVVAYNTYYQLTYRRLGNIAILNHAQLMFDVVVAGVLIYYSGGVYSWFYAMLLLFVLEAAFIFPRARDVWALAAFAALAYVGIVLLEYVGAIPHVDVPFVENALHGEGAFVAVRTLWVVTMLAGTAMVGSLMMRQVRDREREMAECSTIDPTTGLFNRTFFFNALRAEVARATRADCSVAVILMDVYHFSEFNRLFGFDAGNRVLAALAEEFRQAIREVGEVDRDLDTVCRLSGEEFGVIVPEAPQECLDPAIFAARATELAEAFRGRTERLRVDDMSVALSVGVAVYPQDGRTVDDLMNAVDQALADAGAGGGNAVVSADALERTES
jgi:diguanylate cyclase (GGDEF)-like protein